MMSETIIPGLENVNWDEVQANQGLPLSFQSKHPTSTANTTEGPSTSKTLTNLKPAPIPEGPQPLVREEAAPKPFPVDALGSLAAPVKAVQRATGAPVALAGQSALAIASLAVQGFADVQLLHGSSPVSLYCITIALSGERKSACDKLLMRELVRHEEAAQELCREEMIRYQNAADIYSQERGKILSEIKTKKSNSSERASAENDLHSLVEPVAPPAQHRTVNEPTSEGLVRLFQEGQPSLGLFSDEGGQFLGGHGMNRDNAQKTMAALNQLWDGSPIRRTRQGDGSTILYGRRLALHLMVQPELAEKFLADNLAGGIGFLPRCLICQPRSTIGTRLSHTMSYDPAPIEGFGARLREILNQSMPVADDGRILKPRTLNLSASAREKLTEYYDQVEASSAPGRALDQVTGYASKSAEQAGRIAGVLTLWDDLDAAEVSGENMEMAIELATYYLGEVKRLAGGAVVSREVKEAGKLYQWLIERGYEDFTPRMILQCGPNSMRSKDALNPVLAKLVVTDHLVRLPDGHVVEGKARKEAYRVVRKS